MARRVPQGARPLIVHINTRNAVATSRVLFFVISIL